MSHSRFVGRCLVVAVLATVPSHAAGQPGVSSGPSLEPGADIQDPDYGFTPVAGEEGAWRASNPAQRLECRVSTAGMEINRSVPNLPGKPAWCLLLKTTSLARGARVLHLRQPSISADGTRLELDHGPLVEWLSNRSLGIEQGWTIQERPEGSGALRIGLGIGGGFEFRVDDSGRSALLVSRSVTLSYGSLRAWDDRGRELDARMVHDAEGSAIEVIDAGAVYPLTVDPVLAWTAEGGQESATFGSSVASAGDVNGDGYDDVIVGAPKHSFAGLGYAGEATVYMGSPSGLGESPAWTAQSTEGGTRFGTSVSTAGDVNGDGFDDVIVGDLAYSGRVRLYLGFASGLATMYAWEGVGDQAGSQFGTSVACAGDVNGDGFDDVIVGASFYDNGSTDEGRAYVYLGSPSGSLQLNWTDESNQDSAYFGTSVSGAGDVDNDGYDDVIVGAYNYDNPDPNEGVARVYRGSASGVEPSPTWLLEGNQMGALFGLSVSSAGDVDNNGYDDVIVGATNYSNGQSGEGRAFLYLGSASGLSTSPAWMAESDQDLAEFGYSVSGAGDVNGDGFDDVIVGDPAFDGPSSNEGRASLYLGNALGLEITPFWTSESDQPVAEFGFSVSNAGDVNGDGFADVVVGARRFDNGQTDEGAAFLYLSVPDLVLTQQKISDTAGGFDGTLANGDAFGSAVTAIGDLDGNGTVDLAIGAPLDAGNGTGRGAVWILFLDEDGTVASEQEINDVTGGFTGTLDNGDNFGTGLASPGDLDGDMIPDLLVGAPGDDDGGFERGAVWILYLNANGTVKTHAKIASGSGGLVLEDGDSFGNAIASLGDLDGAGTSTHALAVGAALDNGDDGIVWILFLDSSENVSAAVTVTPQSASLPDKSRFGSALARIGELDDTGGSARALAVGAIGDNEAGGDAGAVWILSLNSAGTVLSDRKITANSNGFGRTLAPGDKFGASLGSLGVLDRIGAATLAVGATGDNGDTGAVWILSLDETGRVLGAEKIAEGLNNFTGDLEAEDSFGSAAAALSDLNGDARIDIVVGAKEDDDGGMNRGALWLHHMNDGTFSLLGATTWTGATDSDWTEASNWTGGVPDSNKAAIIPDATGTPNDPLVDMSGQACDALWVQGGGMLDISASADGLAVFGGATVSGSITGTGQLVFEEPGTLAGNATIDLMFDPAVLANADLAIQGGPLDLTGSLAGIGTGTNTVDLLVRENSMIDVGAGVETDGDLGVDGELFVTGSVDVGGSLISSSSGGGGHIAIAGSGNCVTVGGVCFHGDVSTQCSLRIENSVASSMNFELDATWPADVVIDVAGSVNLLTAALSIGGNLLIEGGTFAVGVDGSIAVDSIVIEPGATFDITGFTTTVPAPTPITVCGKLKIGPGGTLVLGANTLTIGRMMPPCTGTLCLDGAAGDPATLTGSSSSRYTLDILAGSTLAAKNFVFKFMSAAGVVINDGVLFAAPPLDLRGGLFDEVEPGGVLLDIRRAVPTNLRYLQFENSSGPIGPPPFNVQTDMASASIKLVNWSGAFVGEPFENDPGVGEPGLIEWALPETSSVSALSAQWGPDHVKLEWTSTSEIDSLAYVLQRSPDPAGTYVSVHEQASTGPGDYVARDFSIPAPAGYRYRLYERLTHGALRFVTEAVVPASSAPDRFTPVWGKPSPPPPPLPLVVGPSGSYPDVASALLGSRGPRVVLELEKGRHASFVVGPECDFDLVLAAQPGAVIDASLAAVRLHSLPAEHSVELRGLVIDSSGQGPGLVIEDTRGVVLLDEVAVRGDVHLANARCVALQGGGLDVLSLEQGSLASASSLAAGAIQLADRSTLETRGMNLQPVIESGSRWLAHERAPRLTLERDAALVTAGAASVGWLMWSPALGFHGVRAIEGIHLLDPDGSRLVGLALFMADGEARWPLGALPPGEAIYLQALTLDQVSGNICLSDVARAEGR